VSSRSSEQIEGRRPVLEALRAGRTITELVVASGTKTSGALAEIVRLGEQQAIPIREIPRRELESRSRTRNPQGVIALAASFRYASLEELLGHAEASGEPALLVALDGITDPQNLGALARSAEAAGAHGLIVPQRRSAGVTAAAEKAASGALEHLPVAQVTNLARAIEELKSRDVWIVALDASSGTTIYGLDVAVDPLCLVIGGEGSGVSRLTRERADVVAHIPMGGRIASLNASAAGAVALFEIRRRRSQS
jgi:23S rRNA (guanosine2251-2'-O)-methyltransferase